MKKSKLSVVIFIVSIFVFAVSCSSGEDSTKKETVKKEEVVISNQDKSTKLEWRAFKTTDKVAVKGTFNDIEIKSGTGKTVEDIITSTSFKISTSSVFTGNEGRDFLLRKFFFGAMQDTEFIEGRFISAKDGKGVVSIVMNGQEYNNNFNYEFANDSLKISTVVLMDNWKGEKALESLHEKCADMHTGADGISKTWSDVEVDILTVMK